MRQMIFALECFLGQFVSMQPFLSGPFFQGLKKSYVIAANTTNSVQHPIASPSRREALTQQLLSLRNRLNLQSAFATFKTGLGILTRQQEIQRFEAGIHKVFQLQEGQAQEAVTVLSKTFSFLAPLVLLAAEKKIDLFIHGTALSYCVYKLAGLPSDINVLIYPTSEENLRQVQAVLSSESLACLKVGMSGSQSVCERYISHGNSTGKIVDVKVVIDRNSYRNEISCDLLSVYLKIEPSLREGVFLTLATRDGQQFICEPKQIQYFLEDARSADYSQIHLALRASRASFSELNQQRLESQRHLWAQAHQRVYQPDYSRYG